MKKILNNPVDYVDEMLAGLTAAHPGFYRLHVEDLLHERGIDICHETVRF